MSARPSGPSKRPENCGSTVPLPVNWDSSASPYIELEQQRLDTEIVFVERLDLPYGLLGRRGVFSRFNEVVFLERVRPPRLELRW